MKNMEKVWKAEQQDHQEKKRIAELKKEIEMEKDREDMTKYAMEQGVIEKKDEKKLDWMYKGPNQMVNREDYLLGRPIDKPFEQMAQTEKDAEQNRMPKNHVEYECIPPSLRFFSGDEQVDLARKLQEDPLYAIKKKEMETRTQLLKNPVKLKQLKELLEQQTKKSKTEKKLKKGKKKKKHKSDSEESDSNDLDSLLAAKYKKLKDQINKKDLLKSVKKTQKDKKSKSKRKSVSSSSSNNDSSSSSDSDSEDDEESVLKHKLKRRRNRSCNDENKSKERKINKVKNDHRNIESTKVSKRKKHKQRNSTSSSSSDSSDSSDEDVAPKSKQKFKKISRHFDDKQYSSESKRQEDSKHKPSHSHEKKQRNTSIHKLSKKHSPSDSSDEDNRKKSSSKKNFGLVRPDGTKIPLQTSKHKPIESVNTHHQKNERDDYGKHQQKRKTLTEEEKERRRQEMMANATWREKDRERNVKRYRQEEDKEAADSTYNKDFIRKQLAVAAEVGTVESRIKANINNIQRSRRAMDTNFARR
ncbi:pre-mRNA-splicing factor CWC25 homolog isoform X2 [Orussus abietinus]|nr:pre-mRNA-splicing factor CWC25 homolog isoform X2 [Orussus abietinus]